MRFSICVTVDRAWIFSYIYRMTEELVSDYRMVSIPHNLNVPVPLLHVTPPTPPYLASIVCYQTKAKKENKNMFSHLLWFWGFSNRPHFQWVQGEVLLSGELRAAVGGALWSCAAVTTAKITVQPQTKVTVLTAHTLMKTGEHKHQETQTEWRQASNKINLIL